MAGGNTSGSGKDSSKKPKKPHNDSSSSSGSNKGNRNKRQKTDTVSQDSKDLEAASDVDQAPYSDAPSEIGNQAARHFETPQTKTHPMHEQPRYVPPPPSYAVDGVSPLNATYTPHLTESGQYPPAVNTNYTHNPVPPTSAPSYASQSGYDYSGSSAPPGKKAPEDDKKAPSDKKKKTKNDKKKDKEREKEK